jgi:hypothetical protein
LKPTGFAIWSVLAACVFAPIVAGFLGHILEFALVNKTELARMYAEDGWTLAQARADYFSGSTAGLAFVLTPVMLVPTLVLGSLLSIRQPSIRLGVISLCGTVPVLFGVTLISGAYADQQVGGVAWGTAILSGPLVLPVVFLIGKKLGGLEEELA